MTIKNIKAVGNVGRIFLFLFIVLFFLSACSKDNNTTTTDNSNLNSQNKIIEKCIKEAEQKYQEKYLAICENNIKANQQKQEACNNIYLPWKKMNIDRDQYCRNTTVESTDPSGNYRECMQFLDKKVASSIDRCIGNNTLDNIKDCKLEGIFLEKLEEDKKENINDCNKRAY